MINLDDFSVPAFAVAVLADGTFRYLGVNALNTAQTGIASSAIVGKTAHDVFEPAIADRLTDHYRCCVEQRRLVDYEVSADFPSGRSWWRASLLPIFGPTGTIDTIVGLCHQFARERPQDRDLLMANKHLDLAIQCLKGADWRFDVRSGRFSASDNLALLMGEDRPRPVDWSEWVDRIDPDDLSSASCAVLIAGETREDVVRFRFRNHRNEVRWARCQRLITGENGPSPVICGVIVDVTEQVERERHLEEEAHHDSLTGLLNRRGFNRKLDSALARRADGRMALAIYMLDLDAFKQINDKYGHATGDAVLVEAARRVTTMFGPEAITARLGGDEFIVARLGIERDDAVLLEHRFAQALNRPHRHDGDWIRMGGSVGLSWRGHAVDPHGMMTEADESLYVRKRARKAAAAETCQGDVLARQMSLFAA